MFTDYWKSYDIMKGISNVSAAWCELSKLHTNGIWCTLLPDYIPYSLASITHNMTATGKETGLDDVNIGVISCLRVMVKLFQQRLNIKQFSIRKFHKIKRFEVSCGDY
jgi:hypothetical protein